MREFPSYHALELSKLCGCGEEGLEVLNLQVFIYAKCITCS